MGICSSCDVKPSHHHSECNINRTSECYIQKNCEPTYQANSYSVKNYNETCHYPGNIPYYYYPKYCNNYNDTCGNYYDSTLVPEYNDPPIITGMINHISVSQNKY